MSPFQAIRHQDLEWQDDDVLALGHGVRVKVFHRDPQTGDLDLLISFPGGYTEPEHVHDGEHHVVILEGRVTVGGTTLGPGDFVLGPRDVPHGPYEYHETTIAFASFRGSALHRYEGSPAGSP